MADTFSSNGKSVEIEQLLTEAFSKEGDGRHFFQKWKKCRNRAAFYRSFFERGGWQTLFPVMEKV